MHYHNLFEGFLKEDKLFVKYFGAKKTSYALHNYWLKLQQILTTK